MTKIKGPSAPRTCKEGCTYVRVKSPGFCNGVHYCSNPKSCHYGHLFLAVHPMCKRGTPV